MGAPAGSGYVEIVSAPTFFIAVVRASSDSGRVDRDWDAVGDALNLYFYLQESVRAAA